MGADNREDDIMCNSFSYNCATPWVDPCGFGGGCGQTTGGGGFAFILVLFILLAIITSVGFFGGGCEDRCERRCFCN